MTKQNRLRTLCEAYFVLWKTVHGDVSHAVDMTIGNVERQCQTTASNKKLSLFRKEGRATTLRREFEQTTANTRSKDANNEGQTHRSAPTKRGTTTPCRRGGPMCPPTASEHTIYPLRNYVARPPKTGGQYVRREQ